MESILTSIKALLGIDERDTAFDGELVVLINGALSKLIQIGVGPDAGFTITGLTETWDEFFGGDRNLEMAKTYVYISVRLLFDPPGNAFIVSAFQKEQEELATRLCWQWDQNHPREAETKPTGEEA